MLRKKVSKYNFDIRYQRNLRSRLRDFVIMADRHDEKSSPLTGLTNFL